MNNIKAEIVAYSISPQGDKLMTVLATFPRIILAEVNTHRMLSKNTSSSRAIPFAKLLEMIETNPFIPIAWQKEHKGMQGSEYITNEESIKSCEYEWLVARDYVVRQATKLNTAYSIEDAPVTKQLCNRLLEPFMWTTMLITGSEEGWNNFFHLRCPSYQIRENEPIFKSWKDVANYYELETRDFWTGLAYDNCSTVERLKLNKGQAEIHIMDLAEKIWDAKNESTPKQLKPGEWHIPFEDKISPGILVYSKQYDFGKIYKDSEECINMTKVKVSSAMSARTSYTVVGEEKEINYENLIGLHDRLLAQQPPHSSPLEHCARAMNDEEYYSFVKGQVNWNSSTILEDINPLYLGWVYNLKGFIPYRYLVDNKINL